MCTCTVLLMHWFFLGTFYCKAVQVYIQYNQLRILFSKGAVNLSIFFATCDAKCVHCTVQVQCTLYVQCTVYLVLYTYCVHCTLYVHNVLDTGQTVVCLRNICIHGEF